MIKKRLIILLMTLPLICFAENYLIHGGQESSIQYELTQEVTPSGKTKYLKLSFVIPQAFESPTYVQQIEDFRLDFKPRPSKEDRQQDKRGNQIAVLTWNDPLETVHVSMRFTARNQTILKPLISSAPFPPADIPREFRDYLDATEQVQSDHPDLQKKAESLLQGVQTEFDAVQRILTFIVDHVRYVTPPKQYDALYAYQSGKGNCQNYSHLSAALMRHAGIPVRIVNGVTLKEPYTVKTGDGEYTFKMGQGRHSWIEVWFPDLGWVPLDPQQTELFVSNRFVRIEVGLDNNETVNDGSVRWRQVKNATGRPLFREAINADFINDNVRLAMAKQNYGPNNILLCPAVEAGFQPVIKPPIPLPKTLPDDQLNKMRYTKPFVFGNLDFPQNIDFMFTREPAGRNAEDEYVMKKNFVVETAEYVTTKMTQYAQIVVLKKPVKLRTISLALQKFGGNGQLWAELLKDNAGKPGHVLATSDFLHLNQLSSRPGYRWVDFDFSQENIVLSPGSYWIALGFTGSPIVNWFYTYGKPVGPVYGTRYKGVYDTQWSGALAYEFNYRISGLTTQQ